MALARKKTRLITVDGLQYRWIVSPKEPTVYDIMEMEAWRTGFGIVVESAGSPGQRMVTWFEYCATISPGLVRRAILHALSRGWRSNAGTRLHL